MFNLKVWLLRSSARVWPGVVLHSSALASISGLRCCARGKLFTLQKWSPYSRRYEMNPYRTMVTQQFKLNIPSSVPNQPASRGKLFYNFIYYYYYYCCYYVVVNILQ